jgi:hypothetical protein
VIHEGISVDFNFLDFVKQETKGNEVPFVSSDFIDPHHYDFSMGTHSLYYENQHGESRCCHEFMACEKGFGERKEQQDIHNRPLIISDGILINDHAIGTYKISKTVHLV